ncbi:M35 family metallo-endopeptidase [Caballeronia glebae]|uniref:M35 family metallo-endopeptidase n=1 Tax=Caballeronia glebae TaxID=1777143 RepID=UPI0038B77A89
MAEQEFHYLGTIITNAMEGSTHEFFVNSSPICPNMTNRQFRTMVLKCRDNAVELVQERLKDLKRWSISDRDRVETWFGKSDDATRAKLTNGLSAIARVLQSLTEDNFVRWDSTRSMHIGCVPNASNAVGAVAEVCAPDTATHTIAIREAFCETREFSWNKDSMVSTLIHEASHFEDTMATKDWQYFMVKCLPFGKVNPKKAIENADSVAGYVIYSM